MSDPREPVALDPAKLVMASASDPGKVRTENQDAVSVLRNVAGERLFLVSDGMGGQLGGETAAKLCVDTLGRVFRDPHGKPEERLRRGLELANEEVYSHALSHPERKGMGATAVALLFGLGRGQVWLAWIGDSRCYRLRDGALEALSRDHSIVAEWIEMGVLNAEEAENHPRRHELTRAIGQAPDVSVEVAAVDARPGDRFLLCSDGLHGSVAERVLKPALAEHPPEECARLLVERANASGGPDNISVVVVDVPADAVVVGEAPVPEVPLEFALPSPPPAPAPEVEPVPEIEPPADEMFVESTAHSSAAIDEAIAELANARKGAELAPASEPDLPPELALGITGSKFEFDLSPPEPDAPDLAATQPYPPAAVAPEAEPLEFAAPPPPPEPAPAPPSPPVQSMEESFADLMDGPDDSDGASISEPLAGFATPPADSRDATAFDSPSLVATPPPRAVRIPLMTPVRARRGLHAPSVVAGLAAGAVVAVLAAAAWLYTGIGSREPAPAPAPQLTRVAPPPRPVAPPTPAPAPVAVPTPAPEPRERAEPTPVPAPAPAPVPVPAPPTAAVAPAPERPPVLVPAPGPAPAPTTVVIVRPSQPPQPPAPPAAPDGAAAASPKLPSSAAFELSAPVHRFVDEWLRAQETHDAPLFTSLGFRDLPTELAGAWTTRDAYRLVAASIDEERSSPDTIYLRLVVSYAFRDATGRFRTEDEERLILRNDNGTLRYEGRWSK